jgi:hypothetical protein
LCLSPHPPACTRHALRFYSSENTCLSLGLPRPLLSASPPPTWPVMPACSGRFSLMPCAAYTEGVGLFDRLCLQPTCIASRFLSNHELDRLTCLCHYIAYLPPPPWPEMPTCSGRCSLTPSAASTNGGGLLDLLTSTLCLVVATVCSVCCLGAVAPIALARLPLRSGYRWLLPFCLVCCCVRLLPLACCLSASDGVDIGASKCSSHDRYTLAFDHWCSCTGVTDF